MSHSAQASKFFNYLSVPTGDIGDQFFQNAGSACASSIVDCLRYIYSPGTQVKSGYHARGYQLSDIGDSPVRTKINERVVPEPIITASQICSLLRQHLDESTQHARGFCQPIFFPIEFRDHCPEFFGKVTVEMIVLHGHYSLLP